MSAKDKAKAKAEKMKGRAKQTTGRATGDKHTQDVGRLERAKGEVRDAVEKVRHSTKGKHGR
ncbi:general stress protein CsbD [Streptomyces cinnamoneus]|uniref:General stress protein CsbD n=1 Tax=Streptomyces cinnamoneus TaxID=53446 RepID=A0A2G1XNL5_STRCJ|nr:CsbD family protein [Streptomyces cinnamoneus]PHQ52806.1 general stress protein CsbD [Streptomyces cinnamoneus]PPT11908.1 CsbD family protein [Streptomyces cinnamoneus]